MGIVPRGLLDSMEFVPKALLENGQTFRCLTLMRADEIPSSSSQSAIMGIGRHGGFRVQLELYLYG